MKKRASLLLAAAGLTATAALAADPLAWPPLTQENKPGTRWWWMGSAVNQADLARELQSFREAGLGNVEVTPIYGVKGAESQFIEYLSPKWLEMLSFTVAEAHKLGLGVDMVTGTGWCFGGPNVSDADANAFVQVKTFERSATSAAPEKIDRAATQFLIATGPDGKFEDLLSQVAPDGTLSWKPEGAEPWRVYALSQKPSPMKVKRPAPGGAGWMLNLLYPDAMPRFLERFSQAFAAYQGPKPHAQFHDSYEYKSNWAPDFFAQFARRRGYRLEAELPAVLEGKGEPDHVARVRSDYRETISEAIEESIARWTRWSHEHGFVSRNQAHGSPGNWLDIYAASDIPETEMYSKDRDILISKFASSAAHLTGSRLVSSETGTWVAEHFQETLADLKYVCDDLFLAGINRVMYHGTAYSPASAAWPGWLFYASTEMNARNSLWYDVPALNTYVARVQSVLQESQPDNDILLYWPIHDFWHDPEESKERVRLVSIHARDWFDDQPLGQTARSLWKSGYSFDYVSDKLLQNAQVEEGAVRVGRSRYRVVLVPPSTHLPVATLEKLLALSQAGARVIFEEKNPSDVPGLSDLEKRRAEFRPLAARLAPPVPTAGLAAALEQAGVRGEPGIAAEKGLKYLRQTTAEGTVYFLANRGTERVEKAITLHTPAAQAVVLDPMTGRRGVAEAKSHGSGVEVSLSLEPGASLLVRTLKAPATTSNVAAWENLHPAGSPAPLAGPWSVQFVAGGPALPPPLTLPALQSWTTTGSEEAKVFGGTARYTLHFDAPAAAANAPRWWLDLGNVRQSARVKLNGQSLGTVFIPPFRVPVEALKPKDNLLEVEVTSTSANRIHDLDARGVKWKIFYDTNMMSVGGKPLDASGWSIAEAGLLGPVTLQPCQPAP